MAEEDLARVYGLGAEAMKRMADLAHQIKQLGGKEEDVRLLGRDRIFQRVAKVLARAGRLTRSFHVNSGGGFEGRAEIFLISLNINSISELEDAVKSLCCHLATKAELDDLWAKNPGFLQDEEKLRIFGQRNSLPTVGARDAGFKYWVMTKNGVFNRYIYCSEVITANSLFAVTFK